jgi:hypothetical protein
MDIIKKLDKYSQPCKFDLILIAIAAFIGFFMWMFCAINLLLVGLVKGNLFAIIIGIIGLYFAKLYYATGRIIQTAKSK